MCLNVKQSGPEMLDTIQYDGQSMRAGLMRASCVTIRIETSTTKHNAAPEAGDSAHPKIINLM